MLPCMTITRLAIGDIPLHNHLMFVCVLYRARNDDNSLCTSTTSNMYQLVTNHRNSLFLICNDFNCHRVRWRGVSFVTTSHDIASKAFCESVGLTQSVNFPTRSSATGTSSLLELVMINFPTKLSCCSSLGSPLGSSDHFLVKTHLSLAIVREQPQ